MNPSVIVKLEDSGLQIKHDKSAEFHHDKKPVRVQFITGQDRNEDNAVAHLYSGTFADPGDPFCVRGWNRSDGEGYSIFRNNVGNAGICKVCARRVKEGRPPVPSRPRKTKWI